MYLSELIGRLNYLLQSEGDMEVARMKTLNTDGCITTKESDLVRLDSKLIQPLFIKKGDKVTKYVLINI